mmetsp:Transcript_21936/g.60892  ORF Transcript_21936/g.60892 Transcript_21936/m.60892 type:complete len:376 (-) Transcript_21936:317-1444(-)|eukprot:CAMPEP_0117673948 /NCGR_PEP_ID=MMETSP0804-20121206/14764_1 /TAXON_ID=1074897 /ORGANISM="Tetraselmis astigmatica, Strain CCMP880" /LENGTH=375 /DNA_ID=CAMNT_0005482759 /DNA_START=112 /DNA_END=1239 /DNA_ORIENTATION=+
MDIAEKRGLDPMPTEHPSPEKRLRHGLDVLANEAATAITWEAGGSVTPEADSHHGASKGGESGEQESSPHRSDVDDKTPGPQAEASDLPVGSASDGAPPPSPAAGEPAGVAVEEDDVSDANESCQETELKLRHEYHTRLANSLELPADITSSRLKDVWYAALSFHSRDLKNPARHGVVTDEELKVWYRARVLLKRKREADKKKRQRQKASASKRLAAPPDVPNGQNYVVVSSDPAAGGNNSPKLAAGESNTPKLGPGGSRPTPSKPPPTTKQPPLPSQPPPTPTSDASPVVYFPPLQQFQHHGLFPVPAADAVLAQQKLAVEVENLKARTVKHRVDTLLAVVTTPGLDPVLQEQCERRLSQLMTFEFGLAGVPSS